MISAKIIVMVGLPASGKSTYVKKMLTKYSKRGVVISRDTMGGVIKDLVPTIEQHIQQKKIVIVDNTNIDKKTRSLFIQLAEKYNIPCECVYVPTPIHICQINALRRMFSKYNDVFMTGKSTVAQNDHNVFPPAALFSAQKRFEAPTLEEGFRKVTVTKPVEPVWDGRKYKKKGLFLDIDGTLRKTDHLSLKYPTKASEVVLLHDPEVMKAKLKKYIDDGYVLIGVSNQSGIAGLTVTKENVENCMQKTRELLGLTSSQFPIYFCPHRAAPVSCFCRKPQTGSAVFAAEKYKINPLKSIFVGDMKVDETTASRLNMKYIHSESFWESSGN